MNSRLHKVTLEYDDGSTVQFRISDNVIMHRFQDTAGADWSPWFPYSSDADNGGWEELKHFLGRQVDGLK